ncbi:MAG: hypothetical protein Q4D57_00690 [Clostridia bacterium]|nr:hypothetical protein [Clostridia bacterium]
MEITSVRDMRAILNQLTDTDDYRALAATCGALNSEWWKFLESVGHMHPGYGIADILFAALKGGKVDLSVVKNVQEGLEKRNIKSLATVSIAKNKFEACGRDVEKKLLDPKFIADYNSHNKDIRGESEQLEKSDIEELLKNIEIVFEALVKLFS